MKLSSPRSQSRGISASRKLVVWTVLIWLAIVGAGLALLWDQRRNEPAVRTQPVVTEKKEALPPVTFTLPGAAKPVEMRDEDYTQPDALWVVVNKQRPIPTDYVPKDLVLPSVLTRADKTQEEQSVRKVIAAQVKELFDAAEAEGLPLLMASGYRSAALQKSYFDSYVRTYGLEYAQAYSALPGTSEHQTGLAIDISTSDRRCYLEDRCFINLPEGKWLAENAHKYGFILRYPEGKEAITGYNFESWHYRYVGKELATALFESGLVLDEALPYFEKAYAELKSRQRQAES